MIRRYLRPRSLQNRFNSTDFSQLRHHRAQTRLPERPERNASRNLEAGKCSGTCDRKLQETRLLGSQKGKIEEMVRPERFELPTFWFVAQFSATQEASQPTKYKQIIESHARDCVSFSSLCLTLTDKRRTIPACTRIRQPLCATSHPPPASVSSLWL